MLTSYLKGKRFLNYKLIIDLNLYKLIIDLNLCKLIIKLLKGKLKFIPKFFWQGWGVHETLGKPHIEMREQKKKKFY